MTAVKPAALVYLDDRALRFRGPGSFPSAREIHSARPWNKKTPRPVGTLDEIARIPGEGIEEVYVNQFWVAVVMRDDSIRHFAAEGDAELCETEVRAWLPTSEGYGSALSADEIDKERLAEIGEVFVRALRRRDIESFEVHADGVTLEGELGLPPELASWLAGKCGVEVPS